MVEQRRGSLVEKFTATAVDILKPYTPPEYINSGMLLNSISEISHVAGMHHVVGIEKHHERSPDLAQSAVACSTRTRFVLGHHHHFTALHLCGPLAHKISSPVRRIIIDEHHACGHHRLRSYRSERAPDDGFTVIGRNYYGDRRFHFHKVSII